MAALEGCEPSCSRSQPQPQPLAQRPPLAQPELGRRALELPHSQQGQAPAAPQRQPQGLAQASEPKPCWAASLRAEPQPPQEEPQQGQGALLRAGATPSCSKARKGVLRDRGCLRRLRLTVWQAPVAVQRLLQGRVAQHMWAMVSNKGF